MKYELTVQILSFLTIFTVAINLSEAQEIRKSYYDNGKVKSEFTYNGCNPEGAYRMFFESGQLKEEGFMKPGESLREGICKTYYENGKVKIEGCYKDGKLDDVQKIYHENGDLMTINKYKNGVLLETSNYKNEKRNDLYREYYDDGSLRIEGIYVDGERDGVWKVYEKVTKILNYKKGVIQHEAEKPTAHKQEEKLGTVNSKRDDSPKIYRSLNVFRRWFGSGIQTTETFTISSNQWKIKYSNTGGGYLGISVYKGNSLVSMAANTTESGEGESWVYQSGTFYLTINSANTRWQVEVIVP